MLQCPLYQMKVRQLQFFRESQRRKITVLRFMMDEPGDIHRPGEG